MTIRFETWPELLFENQKSFMMKSEKWAIVGSVNSLHLLGFFFNWSVYSSCVLAISSSSQICNKGEINPGQITSSSQDWNRETNTPLHLRIHTYRISSSRNFHVFGLWEDGTVTTENLPQTKPKTLCELYACIFEKFSIVGLLLQFLVNK